MKTAGKTFGRKRLLRQPSKWRAPCVLAVAVLVLLGPLRLPLLSAAPQTDPNSFLFNDSHFHLTNYIQEGTDIRDFLKIMGDKVGRVALFGIPLQQEWSYENSGDLAPHLLLADRRASLLLLLH